MPQFTPTLILWILGHVGASGELPETLCPDAPKMMYLGSMEMPWFPEYPS